MSFDLHEKYSYAGTFENSMVVLHLASYRSLIKDVWLKFQFWNKEDSSKKNSY